MFPYQGSKRAELPHIMLHILTDSPRMVNVFAGNGAVFMAMITHVPTAQVIYNDINRGLASIAWCIADGKAADVERKYNALISHITDPGPNGLDERMRNYRAQNLRGLADVGNQEMEAATMLFLIQTGFRGVWNNPRMINLRPLAQRHKITDHSAAIHEPGNISSLDYRVIMNRYQGDVGAFLYLDPPYNSKNTSTQSYQGMAGGYHNYLNFISEFMHSEETCCRVMLNVDFTGDVYVKFKDMIKHVYPVRYSSSTRANDPSRPPLYHVIITNYTL